MTAAEELIPGGSLVREVGGCLAESAGFDERLRGQVSHTVCRVSAAEAGQQVTSLLQVVLCKRRTPYEEPLDLLTIHWLQKDLAAFQNRQLRRAARAKKRSLKHNAVSEPWIRPESDPLSTLEGAAEVGFSSQTCK